MQPPTKRVLCVSDRADACEMLSSLLARRGYEVVTATSLITALVSLREQSFSLFVLDAQFWGGLGEELCGRIRKFDLLTPIILFSSAAEESAHLEVLRARSTIYILKPDLEGLMEAVTHIASDVLLDPAESGETSSSV